MNGREKTEHAQKELAQDAGLEAIGATLAFLPGAGTIWGAANLAAHLGMAGIDYAVGDQQGAREHLTDAAIDGVGMLPGGAVVGLGELAHDGSDPTGQSVNDRLRRATIGDAPNVRYETAKEQINTKNIITPQKKAEWAEQELNRGIMTGTMTNEEILAKKAEIDRLRKTPRPPLTEAEQKRAQERRHDDVLEQAAQENDPTALLQLRDRRRYEEEMQAYREGKLEQMPDKDKMLTRVGAEKQLLTGEGQMELFREIHHRMAEQMEAAGVDPQTVANIRLMAGEGQAPAKP